MPVINPFGVVAGTLSAGTTKATLGEVVFSNSNNVSFGINGQTITASVAGGGGGNTGSISAGTTRATLGEVVFSNSNGISFGVNGQTVTASYTVPNTVGLLSNINVSAGTTSNDLSNVVFSNSNNVSFGLNGSTVTASINTSLTNIRVSAGTTSNLLSAITFSNLNGISFGLDASTITASYTVPTVTNSSWTVSDNATSGTVARLAFTNLNNVTLSLSTGAGGSHTIVGSINTSLTNIRVSAGTTSNLLSAMTFSNANGISFGINASTITASVNTSLTAINISAGTTSNNLSAVTFSNSNGISFGINASTITASYTVPGTLSVYAQSNTTQSSSGTIPFSSLQFQGAGIASVGVSNGSVVISVPPGGGAGMNLGISTLGNTSGTSGLVSNQMVFVGGNNITLSQSINGQSATLTISAGGGGGGGGFSIPYFEVFPRVSLSNVSNMTATLITQRPILIPFQLIGSLTHNFMDIEVSRATTGSNAFTMQAAIYTFVNSTQISRLASLQNVFSNTDTANISGIRRIRLTGWEAAGTTLTPGQYVMMLYNSATATASMNYSYRGGITASPDVGVIGGGTDVITTATSAMSNGGFRLWHGLWSTTTASPPGNIALSDVSQHTRGLPIYFYMASK
jgi:hypothetical protein